MPLELSGGALPGYLISMASRLTANIDLSWVIEEVEETYTSDTAKDNGCVAKKCLQLIQLGKGKWPGHFIAAFQTVSDQVSWN